MLENDADMLGYELKKTCIIRYFFSNPRVMLFLSLFRRLPALVGIRRTQIKLNQRLRLYLLTPTIFLFNILQIQDWIPQKVRKPGLEQLHNSLRNKKKK